MFEIKGKYLTSRYYARKIPMISIRVYEMSRVPEASFFYKTTPFPTRIIDLSTDFEQGYNKRLLKYLRNAEEEEMKISRPDFIPDLEELYLSVTESKGLDPIHQSVFKSEENHLYSEVHHPDLGRLSAHLSIADSEENMVFGLINASAFRLFGDPRQQRLSSIANKYLFHKDMEYFKSLGFAYYDMVGTREPMNQMKKEFGGEIQMTWTHVPRPVYFLQKWFNRNNG